MSDGITDAHREESALTWEQEHLMALREHFYSFQVFTECKERLENKGFIIRIENGEVRVFKEVVT